MGCANFRLVQMYADMSGCAKKKFELLKAWFIDPDMRFSRINTETRNC